MHQLDGSGARLHRVAVRPYAGGLASLASFPLFARGDDEHPASRWGKSTGEM
jgi:hypothetical protein